MEESEGAKGGLMSCDACTNAFFSTNEQLEEHIFLRHKRDIFPDYDALRGASNGVQQRWDALLTLPSFKEKLAGWGAKTFRMACQRDGGKAKMLEAHAARAQLEVAVRRWHPNTKVYIFGSSVALGVWDGASDIDFTVVDVDALENGTWNPNEKNAVRSIAQVLHRAGFSPSNMELIPFARVPIIKHHADTPLIPLCAQEDQGVESLKQAEQVVARSVRISLASAASPQDRLLLEGSIRSVLEPNTIEQLWWDRKGLQFCVTCASTVDAMKVLTCLPAVTPQNRCTRLAPLNDEYRPELFHLDFDLSFRVFGIRNSVLLRQYLVSHPCGRPGSICLKDWSKTSGVNNSHAGYITSYAINILWIYFLVQRGHVQYIDPLDIPASLTHNTEYDPPYIPMEDKSLADDAKKKLHVTMGEYLVDFFRFYSCEFNWKEHVVSLNRKDITTKAQLGWDHEDVQVGKKHTRYEFCIEDPYEENLNLGRHIGPTKIKKVMMEFHRALLSLVKDDIAESCVFEHSDNVNTTTETPPVKAMMKLTTLMLREEFQHKASSTAPLSADHVKLVLNASASEELALALRCWSWPQLLHRMGFNCIGDNVYRRGTFPAGTQRTVGGNYESDAAPQHTRGPTLKEIFVEKLSECKAVPPQQQAAAPGTAGVSAVGWKRLLHGKDVAVAARYDTLEWQPLKRPGETSVSHVGDLRHRDVCGHFTAGAAAVAKSLRREAPKRALSFLKRV